MRTERRRLERNERESRATVMRLKAERLALAQEQVRALNAGDADEAIFAATTIDAGAAMLMDGWQRLHAVRRRQADRLRTVGLHGEASHRGERWSAMRQHLQWLLLPTGLVNRPYTHAVQERTLEEIEPAIQLGQPSARCGRACQSKPARAV